MNKNITGAVFVFGITLFSFAAYAQDSAGAAAVVMQPPSSAGTSPAPAAPEGNGDDIVAALPSGTVEPTPPPMTPLEKEIMDQVAFQNPTVNVNLIPSLFFSIWEHDLIVDARRGLKTRRPDDGNVAATGIRDISLGGIVYVSAKDWTIWLNETRVSPQALPEEVMDLKVHKDYIDLEWFDAGTNQIFPIRLRTHQRFNLDTRIFLPG